MPSDGASEKGQSLLQIFFLTFWSEHGEFCCILGGVLCDLELQESKQETRQIKECRGSEPGDLATLNPAPHAEQCRPTLT